MGLSRSARLLQRSICLYHLLYLYLYLSLPPLIHTTVMADAFVGTWNLKESENFDEYMKALGVGFAMRQVAGDTVTVKTQSTFKNTEINFKLGEEFDETTADGRKVKSVVSTDGAKLVHVQKWDGNETSLTREVTGDNLTLTCALGDVVSTRHYVRA